MELSSFQRLVAFAAVVIVLAGLGVYLFLPSASGTDAGPVVSPSAPASSSPGPAPSGPVTPSTAASPGQLPDIYQWLPFTSSGLASAAQVAVKFGADYGTFSYSQNVAAYLAPMRSLITSQLGQLLGRAYAAPGVAATRVSKKQVSSGSAVIASLRAFGSSSLTFVVVITERITESSGTSQQVTDFAVTLTGAGTSWQVSDIELASAGNL
jgi:hypothetical protein